MFAKLRMSIDEAYNEFFTIIEEVYKPAVFSPQGRTQKLRECMELLLQRKGLATDLKLEAEPHAELCAR